LPEIQRRHVRHDAAVAGLDRDELRRDQRQVRRPGRHPIAAGQREGALAAAVEGAQHRIAQPHLRRHRRGRNVVQVVFRRHPLVAGQRVRALVEQRVVAQLVAMRGQRAPFRQAPRQAGARQREVEARLQAEAVERRHRVVELRVDGVVVSEADRGAFAVRPAEGRRNRRGRGRARHCGARARGRRRRCRCLRADGRRRRHAQRRREHAHAQPTHANAAPARATPAHATPAASRSAARQ
jgi:hypothetical protein